MGAASCSARPRELAPQVAANFDNPNAKHVEADLRTLPDRAAVSFQGAGCLIDKGVEYS